MEKEYINGLKEEHIKENGNKIECMERVFILGQMEENMKGNIIWIKNMEMESIHG